MILGIHKWQWLLVLAAVAGFLAVNLLGMREEVQYNEQVKARVLESVAEAEIPSEIHAALWGCTYPWPKITAETAAAAGCLAALAWLVVFISQRGFFQRWPRRLKYAAELLLAFLTGGAFMAASLYFAYHWIEDFICGTVLGLRQPDFAWKWSIQFVFPAASALIFVALALSNRRAVSAGLRPPPPNG